MQSSPFSSPDHKRTQSDAHKLPSRSSHPGSRHHRSYSQTFDPPRFLWPGRHSPSLETVQEEDGSDSEEAIRKILQERRGARTSQSAQSSIAGLHASMTSLLSQRQEDARRTDTARSRLKQAVLQLMRERETVETESPDTVVTLKSSIASATTVLEDASLLDFRPEERKDPCERSFSKGSEADNTVIADAEVLQDSDLSSSQVLKPTTSLQRFKPNNHKLIKNAISAICLAGEANRRAREDVLRLIATHQSPLNFVIAFKGTLGRHEMAALYEHDLAAGHLRKLYGPPMYPEQVTAALVQSCYRYDSSAREFRYLHNRRFAFGMDAVSLHRRL